MNVLQVQNRGMQSTHFTDRYFRPCSGGEPIRSGPWGSESSSQDRLSTDVSSIPGSPIQPLTSCNVLNFFVPQFPQLLSGERDSTYRDFAGCPVVLTLASPVGGAGLIPGQGSKIPHVMKCSQKTNKNK